MTRVNQSWKDLALRFAFQVECLLFVIEGRKSPISKRALKPSITYLKILSEIARRKEKEV